jgi:hypothetical protein
MTASLPQLEEEHAAPQVFTLRGVAVFGSMVSIILLSANAWVCAAWSYFSGLPGLMVGRSSRARWLSPSSRRFENEIAHG